jgi:hypothetical protein
MAIRVGSSVGGGPRVPLRPAREAREKAASGSGWYAVLARSGLVAKGISFGIVGGLAVALAAGGGGKATSREGALGTLAGGPVGTAVLVLLAAGFAAYACWRFVQAFAERGEDNAGKLWLKRAGYVGRGIVYAGLTASTVKLLLGSSGQESQTGKAHRATAEVLSWPAGTWLVGVAGVVIVGVAAWNAYRGIARTFEDKWRTGELGPTARTWGGRAGVVGHLARAVVFTLIGVFLVKAAVEYDPRESIGLDGALQKLAHAGYGPYLLGVTAVGLICYAIYCLVDARCRDVSVDASGSGQRSPATS